MSLNPRIILLDYNKMHCGHRENPQERNTRTIRYRGSAGALKLKKNNRTQVEALLASAQSNFDRVRKEIESVELQRDEAC